MSAKEAEMFDFIWKFKIDKKIERDEILKKKLEDQARRQLKLQEQSEYNEKLKELQSKFKCHIGGELPNKPYLLEVRLGYGESRTDTDWSKPGDLEQCLNCHKYTCAKHLHKGICKKCAKKF